MKLATYFLHPLKAVLNLLFHNFPCICWHKQEKYKNQRKILAKGVANAQISWNLVRRIYRASWFPKCIIDYLSSEIYANVCINWTEVYFRRKIGLETFWRFTLVAFLSKISSQNFTQKFFSRQIFLLHWLLTI